MPGRVLIVEDDHATELLLAAVMRHEGIEYESASDGEIALAKIRGGDFAVLLLDLVMPHLSGFDVVHELKATHPHLLPNIVVMTAAVDSAWLDWEDLALVSCVLRKPLDIGRVIQQVRSCLADERTFASAGNRR